MARVLDIGGVFDDYNYSDTPEEADARAMRNDWISVGEFLSDALERTLAEYTASVDQEALDENPLTAQVQLPLR